MAVLLISNEVEEILGLAHRVLVMRAGRIVAELAGAGHDRGGDPGRGVRHDHRRAPHEPRRRSSPAGRRPRSSQRAGRVVGRAGILIPFLIAFVVLSLISPPFLRVQNLTNILDQQAGIIIVACAGTLVLIAGGIDLSIGAIYGLAGAVALTDAHRRCRRPVGIAGRPRRSGSRSGSPTASSSTRFRINPLIGTLAMSFVVSGIAAIVTKGNLVVAFDQPDFQAFAATKIAGHHERGLDDDRHRDRSPRSCSAGPTFGRYVYATGGNAQAARLGGVRVNAIRVATSR